MSLLELRALYGLLVWTDHKSVCAIALYEGQHECTCGLSAIRQSVGIPEPVDPAPRGEPK